MVDFTLYNQLPLQLFTDKFVRNTRGNEEEEEEQGYCDGGEVIGKFGIDNIPAMLSDGEFVLVPVQQRNRASWS